eukprot:314504-Rhodomonas_salina.1
MPGTDSPVFSYQEVTRDLLPDNVLRALRWQYRHLGGAAQGRDRCSRRFRAGVGRGVAGLPSPFPALGMLLRVAHTDISVGRTRRIHPQKVPVGNTRARGQGRVGSRCRKYP